MAFLRSVIARSRLLVAPVGSNAVLCNPVHLLGADLDFHRHAVGAQHHSVQRLVPIILLVANVIFEAPLNRRPKPVHLSITDHIVETSYSSRCILERIANPWKMCIRG